MAASFGSRQPKQNRPERFLVDYVRRLVGAALSLQMMMVSTQGKRKNQTSNALIIGKTFFRRKK